jgi:peptidoglycan/LPS O-acetylase OafA/YrhL
MEEGQSSPPPNKLPGLELLRFAAAFAVLIWHYQHFSYVADTPVDLFKDRLPYYTLLQPFYLAGRYGVWIFWCISGFIFYWKYRGTIADRSIGGWEFFVLRLSRIYPLHAVTLALVAILQPIFFHLNGYFFVYQVNDLQHFLLQTFVASNWWLSEPSFNGPIWTISVEIVVYLVFFLSLRFVSGSALLNVVIIFVCIGAKGQVPACLAFFYIGGLAALARRALSSSVYKAGVERVAWFAAVAAAALWGPFFLASSHEVPDVAILAYTPIVLFCISGDINVPPAIQRLIEAAGNLTYSSYLLHFPIQLIIALGFATYGAPIPFYDARFFLAFVGITLVASRLTYLYFEAPAQRIIRDRLLRRSGALAATMAFTAPERS